ncbi:gamma-glutamyltransferase, partial [Nocardioides sp. SYSU DS0663]|uniref:gamma-glutamyltransferase n=1 Tax=Nocardioides sp. SYSU DS0663 TaxID=3416445 RepID=UPI003F4C22E5
ASLGVLGRARLVAPARALATRGAVWSPMSELLARESVDLLRTHQPDGCVYDPPGGPLAAGDLLPLPGLARLLEDFAREGARLFSGPAGTAFVDRVARAGGVITAADLGSVQVLEERAHRVTTAAGSLWATNAPTYGAALTEVFKDRELAEVGPELVRTVLARQSRGELVGAEGTSTVAAVDAAGNAVVVVHSNSFPQFGSGLVVEPYDLVLSNRAGRGFAFQPGHPNAPVPGRRPLTTLHAWATERDDGWLLGGTPGGEQQVPWNVQVLSHLFAHGTREADLGEAVLSPRWQLAGDAVSREGVDLPELGARCSHTLVRWSPTRVSAAADPRWDGEGVAA